MKTLTEEQNRLFSPEDLKKLGIVDWGYTEVARAPSYSLFSDWVDKGHHGPLAYLADERKEKRQDLRNIFPEFQSALVFLFSYAEVKRSLEDFYLQRRGGNFLRFSSFVFAFGGVDYHQKMREHLESLSRKLRELHPGLKVFLTLDVHPVLERDLARRSGLGWFGKNSLLIHPEHGSYTLIGSLLLSQKLEGQAAVERPMADHCGHCLACVEACPTAAILPESRTLDASKCISTFTIELFKDGSPPPEGYLGGQGEIFGCEICQEVCPWNKRKLRLLPAAKGPLAWQGGPLSTFFLEREGGPRSIMDQLLSMSNKGFQRFFKGTSLERTGRKGLMKNILPYLS